MIAVHACVERPAHKTDHHDVVTTPYLVEYYPIWSHFEPEPVLVNLNAYSREWPLICYVQSLVILVVGVMFLLASMGLSRQSASSMDSKARHNQTHTQRFKTGIDPEHWGGGKHHLAVYSMLQPYSLQAHPPHGESDKFIYVAHCSPLDDPQFASRSDLIVVGLPLAKLATHLTRIELRHVLSLHGVYIRATAPLKTMIEQLTGHLCAGKECDKLVSLFRPQHPPRDVSTQRLVTAVVTPNEFPPPAG